MSGDIRCERSFILIPSIRDPDFLKQSKFTHNEVKLEKIGPDKLHRQRTLEENFAVSSIE